MHTVFLASKSPRRKQLLEQIGLKAEIISVDIDETALNNEEPADYVVRLAHEKGCAAKKTATKMRHMPLISADTCVVLDKHILGKPQNTEAAVEMLSLLSGKTHYVHTGISVMNETKHEMAISTSSVTFRSIPKQEIIAYCKTNEPFDKAGGYGIQGIGAIFVTALKGSYSGVMGLPLMELAALLKKFNISPLE